MLLLWTVYRLVRLLIDLPPFMVRLVAGGRVEIDGQVMDPQSQMMNRLVRRMKVDDIEAVPPPTARRRMEKLTRMLPRAPVRGVRDFTVEGRDGPIGIREYRPEFLPTRAPAVVYFHGGGWVLGSPDTHDYGCGALARDAGCVVYSVDYRLAPEHPYPAALHDCCDAFDAVVEAADALDLDPERVAVAGDSAGGNLAAALALHRRDADGTTRPCAQLLIYPAVDLARERASAELFADGFLLTRAAMRYFISAYVPEADERHDPLVSPLRASSHENLPPAHVVIAGYDPLRDEGREYADLLHRAGVDVELELYPSTFHGFWGMPGLDVFNQALAGAAASLRRVFADMS